MLYLMPLQLQALQNQWFCFDTGFQKQRKSSLDKQDIIHLNHILIYACFFDEILSLF